MQQKQHLRMLFVRAGILDGRKRVKLARYAHNDKSHALGVLNEARSLQNSGSKG
jgi:hypothetical protein